MKKVLLCLFLVGCDQAVLSFDRIVVEREECKSFVAKVKEAKFPESAFSETIKARLKSCKDLGVE